MSRFRVLPYGRSAMLVETDRPALLAAALTGADGVLEAVPGAETVLVRHCPERRAAVLALIEGATGPASAAGDGRRITVEVVYDGADLADVAGLTGLSPAEVVALHCGAEYSVAFCGFAPGFAYLDGLPAPLQLPRLRTPRTRVPAGAVAIAGQFAGVYPRPSPGGWRLLGTTTARLWDLDRDPPALLTPGTRVRFVAVGR